MNSGEFNIIISITDDDIIRIDRTATMIGEPELTESFHLQLPDPKLYRKICKILCP